MHEFPETASTLGIVETSPDVFHVCTGKYSSDTLQGFGEAYVFKVDMRYFSPNRTGLASIAKVATLSQAKGLNGLTYLGGNSTLLLVSDFILGVIFSVDIDTGISRVAINNSYTRSPRYPVNGLKVRNGFLYFSNGQQQSLVKVAINAKGEAVGNFLILAQGNFAPDDFAIDSHGDFYVASYLENKDGLVFIPREGGPAVNIARISGPTACAFGRTAADRDVLYVTTSGGDYDYLAGKPIAVSGKIVKVEVGRRG